MSADFPNEAARCQRFLSERAQSNFEPRDGNGPAATRPPCYLMQNARSKSRVLRTNSVRRAVAQLGRAPGSGPGGRGFKSHQPDFNSDCRVVAAATDREFKIDQPDLNYGFSNNVSLLRVTQRKNRPTLRGFL